MKIKTQEIYTTILKDKGVKLFIKRIDQIHDYVSGNKWFKLKYNMIDAKKKKVKSILTFGGAYSNHIASTAFLAKENGFKSIGIIRGEEHFPYNPTLKFAVRNGMEINYINRSDYRLKSNDNFLEKLKEKFGDFYLLPEGGTNELAIKGAAEILDINDSQDYICCSVGTGGTIAGIINSIMDYQKVIGFPAIKGSQELEKDIKSWVSNQNFELINNCISSGYAKLNDQLVDFVNDFYESQKIPLDGIYTGKMMFQIMDLVSRDYFPPGSSVLVIHSGGLQGNRGLNERFGLQLPIY